MITTRSKFYYLSEEVTRNNNKLDFNDGSVRVATLNLGSYSPKELGDEIQRAMNDASTVDFTVVFNRTTRKYTISAGSSFSLLPSSGTNAASDIFQLAGFNATDKTGTNTYTSDNVVGVEYIPQFFVQNYVSTEDFQEKIQPSVNESASGVTEVVSFGVKKFCEMNLKFITAHTQPSGGVIENNASGVTQAREFLRTLVSKRNIEFMEDRDTPNTFEIFLCEKLASSSTGTGYKLKEMISRNMGNYFETGKITFRKMD